MKRAFHFRLARVQRVRELFEETARTELSAALGAVHAMEDKISAWTEELRSGRADLARAQAHGHLDVDAHIARQRTLSTLEVRILEADAERERLAEVAEEARAAWQERRSDKEALARLSDRHRERHRAELERAEAAELDEVAIQRARRKSQESASSPAPAPADKSWSAAPQPQP